MAATVTLAPVVKTAFYRRITRSGLTASRECWAAETTDGAWKFDREDSPGTPWLVYSTAAVADGSYPLPVTICGTLRACRAFAAAPYALEELARRKAEWAGRDAL
jgi:hypothetical protein